MNAAAHRTRVLLGAILAGIVLGGCGTEAIVVSEAAITDRPDARVVGWTADEAPRAVFSPEDEEVTLRALFEFNYRGVYEWYTVEWLAPDGTPYQVVSTRTDFGSHRDLNVSMKIRGKMASRLPGVWRVRLWLRGRDGAPDRLLVSRLFRISEPSEEMLAKGLTPVDAPVADARRPLASAAATALPPPPPPPKEKDEAAGKDAPVEKIEQDKPTEKTPPRPADPEPFPLLPPVAVLPPSAPDPALIAAAQANTEAAVASNPAAQPGIQPESRPEAAGIAANAPQAGTATTTAVPPAATERGVVSVSLTSRPGPATPAPRAPLSRFAAGCPPMYYPPGPGCVEEAPEE